MDSIADIKRDIEAVTSESVWFSCTYSLQGEDINELGKRLPILKSGHLQWKKGMLIRSDFITFAIILGEYATAERIIDDLSGVNSAIDKETKVRDTAGNTEYISFAEIFYSKDIDIPEELRFKILKRLNEDIFSGAVTDGGLIDINEIRELDKREVQEKIVNDYHRHPEYFDQRNCPRMISEIPAACFLMKLYQNDPYKLEMLMTERLEILFDGYKVWVDRDIRSDFLKLKKALSYSWMKRYMDSLYAMLITMFTGIKKALGEDISDVAGLHETIAELKSVKTELAGLIPKVTVTAEEYLSSLEKTRRVGFDEALECLASGERILGHKPKLIIKTPTSHNPETFFGFREDDREEEDDYIWWNEEDEFRENREKSRLMRLAEYTGNIEYRVIKSDYLAGEISSFLLRYADLLRDSFKLLAEKGLVPDSCIGQVINRVRKAGNCEYMMPDLIMQGLLG